MYDKPKYSKSRSSKTKQLGEYLSRIEQGFGSISSDRQDFVYKSIDSLVKAIETGDFEGLLKKTESTRKNIAFDAETAVKVREESGFKTAQSLANELGLKRPGYVQLQYYERGDLKPSNPPRGLTSKIYIRWLKNHGYNPYKLK